MKMVDYLESVEYAVRQYYDSIRYYEEMVFKTVKELAEAKVKLQIAENQLSLGEWDPDDNLSFGFMDHYHAQRAKSATDIGHLQPILERLAVQRDSVAQLSGSILQVAKQGLSVVYRHQQNWPANDKCGSQPVSYIIRMARNQSLHYEEEHGSWEECFKKMEHELGLKFDLSKNMARKVLKDVLQWKDAEKFSTSMLNLH